MWKWMAALSLLLVSRVFSQDSGTAYEALRVVSNQLGRASVNHVISVTGENGDPQPATWRVLLEAPSGQSGVREVTVKAGRVASDHAPSRQVAGSREGATIKPSHLNLDSSGAYAVAFHTADKSGTQFSTVNYTLRTDERGEPVWVVTLFAQDRAPVGTIFIGANRGTVTRTEGMFGGTTMRDVQTDQPADNTDDGGNSQGGIVSNTKARFRASFRHAQDNAREMFNHWRRSFADFIAPN
jgi:hypothetical protein